MAEPHRLVRVAFATLGCRVNAFDTTLLEEGLDPARVAEVPFDSLADVYVVNTCTVTASADAQARNLVRRARRRNPQARIVVTGCYAAARPDELRAMPEIDRVLTLGERDDAPKVVAETARLPILAQLEPSPDGALGVDAEDAIFVRARKRPVIKIQDGCDVDCSFCVIPTSRGRERRSMAPDEVVRRVRRAADAGAPEVVLTGPYVGGYGDDLSPPVRLASLLRALLALRLGPRLRVSSIQPTELDDAFVEVFASEASARGGLCRHLHVPLQSGDDAVLARMNRPYGADDYAALVRALAERVPGIGLGADVIVGHPGEDRAAFERTLALVGSLPLAYLHVFPYSPRPGTPAAAMKDAAPIAETRARAAELRSVGEALRARFARAQVGTRLRVVVQRVEDGVARGYADNFVEVAVVAPHAAAGEVVDVRIVGARGPTAEAIVEAS